MNSCIVDGFSNLIQGDLYLKDCVNSLHNVVRKIGKCHKLDKISDLCIKVLECIEVAGSKSLSRISGVFKAIKGAVYFCASVDKIVLYLSPFEKTKEMLNLPVLRSSLESALTNAGFASKLNKNGISVIDAILEDVLGSYENFDSRIDLCEALKNKLVEKTHILFCEADEIIKKVKISYRPRTIGAIITGICFDIVDFGSNLMTIRNVEFLKLGKLVETIGRYRVFSFIKTISLASINIGLSSILITGYGIKLVTIVRNIVLLCRLREISNVKGLEGRKIELRNSLVNSLRCPGASLETDDKIMLVRKQLWWDLGTTVLDLVSTVLPLAGLVINPPLVLGLALISKTAGMLSTFYKP